MHGAMIYEALAHFSFITRTRGGRPWTAQDSGRWVVRRTDYDWQEPHSSDDDYHVS
ncbi:MAG: hypothetical protein ACI9OJ_000863 [Myxococcota bacterium]|jgi:hypothetical protein